MPNSGVCKADSAIVQKQTTRKTVANYILLGIAAFLAGVLNTVAGGGSFITFPALVYVGLPAISANATSAVAVFPGYLSAAAGFRAELATFDRALLLRILAAASLGGMAGALLLLTSSIAVFSAVVPFLLALATVVFAFSDAIQAWAKAPLPNIHSRFAGVFLVSAYGGYFNGGLGILLLALLTLWGIKDIHLINGLKSGLSFALSATSVLLFVLAGKIAWPQAVLMMGACTIGGYAGAPLARALPKRVVRVGIVIIGATMTGIFFYRWLSQ